MTSADLESSVLDARAKILGALGDPTRLEILDFLAAGEHCVCDLQDALGVAPNLLSYHLRVLRETGLVTARRLGRRVEYRIAESASARIRDSLPLVEAGVG